MNPATKNKLSIIVIFCLGFFLLRMPSEKVCVDVKNEHVCLRILRNKYDQSRGFQLVEALHPNEGLLYILPETKKPNFWMKNVFQHLDIVFIDTHGQVLDVIHAYPHRTNEIPPPKETIYVIELLDGRAQQLNLLKGSCLPHQTISELKDTLLTRD